MALRRMATLAVLALLLPACGSGQPEGGGEGAPAATTARGTSTATTTATSTSTAATTTAAPTTTGAPAPACPSTSAPTVPSTSTSVAGPDDLVEYPQEIGVTVAYRPGVEASLRVPDIPRSSPAPAVVSLVGGFGWELAMRGFFVLEVGTAPGAPLSTGSFDAQTVAAIRAQMWEAGIAVQWLRANAGCYGIDPDAVAVAGRSFGAIAALSLAYSEDEPVGDRTAISLDAYGGTVPLVAIARPPVPPSLAGYSNDPDAVVALSGFALPEGIDAGEPPALLIHGRDDERVPFALAEQTCRAATAVGVTCELVPLDGGHGVTVSPALVDTIVAFLDRTLGSAG